MSNLREFPSNGGAVWLAFRSEQGAGGNAGSCALSRVGRAGNKGVALYSPALRGIPLTRYKQRSKTRKKRLLWRREIWRREIWRRETTLNSRQRHGTLLQVGA